jgi:hypothetical protein
VVTVLLSFSASNALGTASASLVFGTFKNDLNHLYPVFAQYILTAAGSPVTQVRYVHSSLTAVPM